MNRTRTLRKRLGFTMLELVVTIVILAVLAGLAIPTFAAVTGKSKAEVALSEAKAWAREVNAYAAFTTNSDVATAISAVASDLTGGQSYSSGTFTSPNGCTVAITEGADSVSVGSVSCDGAGGGTTTTTVPLAGPASLDLNGYSFFSAIGPGGSNCDTTTLCANWTSTHTVLWKSSSSLIYAWFPSDWLANNTSGGGDPHTYQNGVSPQYGVYWGYCDQQSAAMSQWFQYSAGDPTQYNVTAADPCLA